MRNRIFLCFPEFKEKAVTLSYDDGVRQDKRLLSIMKKNGIKGTFNINSGLFETEKSSEVSGRMMLDEAVSLYADVSCEIAAHGYKHLNPENVTSAAFVDDIITDRRNLEKIFGDVVVGSAYAYGAYNDEIIACLKACGIKWARTVNCTNSFSLPDDWFKFNPTCRNISPNLKTLAEEFISVSHGDKYCKFGPSLFYMWGHSYEFDMFESWRDFEEIAAFLGNRDDVWYATNGEIYEYVNAYDNLLWSVNGDTVKNLSSLDIWLNYYGKKIKLKSGEFVKLKDNNEF